MKLLPGLAALCLIFVVSACATSQPTYGWQSATHEKCFEVDDRFACLARQVDEASRYLEQLKRRIVVVADYGMIPGDRYLIEEAYQQLDPLNQELGKLISLLVAEVPQELARLDAKKEPVDKIGRQFLEWLAAQDEAVALDRLAREVDVLQAQLDSIAEDAIEIHAF